MKFSLTLRLVLSASIVLAAFFGIAGLVLENAFREGAEQATRERLEARVYALLSAAELNESGELALPVHLPESRFSTPGSGLYGAVFKAQGLAVWRSASAIGIDFKPLLQLNPGQPEFRIDESGLFLLYYPLVWEDQQGKDQAYVFVVAEDTDAVQKEIAGFSGTLWRWFLGIGLILVLVQVAILAWSLRPLRALAKEIEAIESGAKSRLNKSYPKELQGVTANINALLDAEHSHLDRYRNTLSNLAHSLKTPLAVLRGVCNEPSLPDEARSNLAEQISRMHDLIEYQMQKAAAKGKNRLARPIKVIPVIEKLIDALNKVYAAKTPSIALKASGPIQFACEEGDLMEIVGNLLDNACKWCRESVRITLDYGLDPAGLWIVVEDDGPGIPKQKLKEVLRRGVRADERIRGHGIGLAVVVELIQLCEGRLSGQVSELGGLQWNVWLPGRGSMKSPQSELANS